MVKISIRICSSIRAPPHCWKSLTYYWFQCHNCTQKDAPRTIIMYYLKNLSFILFSTDRPTGNHSNQKKIFDCIIFFFFDWPTALKGLEKNPPSIKSTERGLKETRGVQNNCTSLHVMRGGYENKIDGTRDGSKTTCCRGSFKIYW